MHCLKHIVIDFLVLYLPHRIRQPLDYPKTGRIFAKGKLALSLSLSENNNPQTETIPYRNTDAVHSVQP